MKINQSEQNRLWENDIVYLELPNGNLAVAWTAHGTANGIETQNVYARIFDPKTGDFITDEINLRSHANYHPNDLDRHQYLSNHL